MAFSSDGATLASAGYDSTARLWDPATGQVESCVALRSPAWAIAWSGRALAVGADAGLVVLTIS